MYGRPLGNAKNRFPRSRGGGADWPDQGIQLD
jgi:hypothetical protein